MSRQDKISTAQSYLDARKWTLFLKELPLGQNDWKIADYRDFISLRSTASMMSNSDDFDRRFSINQSVGDDSKYIITVKRK